ncbi:MAG: hypothetical protein HUJ88_12915 [Fusobacterium necrophorum]|nr:hypothetical protein [Fusobacterium necrophorum]
MASLEEKMRKKFAQFNKMEETKMEVVQDTIKTTEISLPIEPIYKKEEFGFIDNIVEEEELRDFLKEKTAQLLSTDQLSKVIVGKLFNQIFEKIGSYKNGAWVRWCHELGIPDRTALRYRNRASFFDKMTSNHAKKVALTMPQEDLEFLLQEKELCDNVVIPAIEKGAEKDVVKMYIKNFKLNSLSLPEAPEIYEELDVETMVYMTSSIQKGWKELEVKKQKKIKKLFSKIQQILKGE